MYHKHEKGASFISASDSASQARESISLIKQERFVPYKHIHYNTRLLIIGGDPILTCSASQVNKYSCNFLRSTSSKHPCTALGLEIILVIFVGSTMESAIFLYIEKLGGIHDLSSFWKFTISQAVD